uniref:Uncharacterized protein n=1 Tax=Acrobeloides nanus TaxID=290746 RepID=A0A914BX41_9BILA
MFIENRNVVRVSKVYSEALNEMVNRRYMKEPDLSWKREIHDLALALRLSTNSNENQLDIYDLHDGIDLDAIPDDLMDEEMNEEYESDMEECEEEFE